MTTTVSTPGQRPADTRRKSETHRLFNEAQAAATTAERERIFEEIVLINIDFARSLARRFRNRGVALEDLEQVALLTLVRVVPKFDPSKDRDFLAYAVPSIRGDLKRYFRDHAWTVRPPRRVQEIQLEVQRAHARAREIGEPMSAEAIAEDLQLKPADVEEALLADGCFHPLSLDTPFTGDPGSSSLGETIPTTDEEAREAAEARVLLEPLLRELGERDRRIVHLRFAEGRTQQEIADELGVTQMQVSRLLSRILRQLREGFGASPLEVA
jgi:RNA polymerase sigma-B factor